MVPGTGQRAPPTFRVNPRLQTQQVGSLGLPPIRAPSTGMGTHGDGSTSNKDSRRPALPEAGMRAQDGKDCSTPWPGPRASKVTLGVIKAKVLTCRLEDIT